MLDWVSIRDPTARAAAKAAYCQKHPLPRAGGAPGHNWPEARLLCFGRRPYAITTAALPAGAWRKWRPAPTANRSPTRWFPLSGTGS